MKKGGLADSPFFQKPQPIAVPSLLAVNPPQFPTQKERNSRPNRKIAANKTEQERKVNPDTVIPRHHATMADTTTPRYHDTMVEAVRKAVKEFGKEAATHRFTTEEKKALADIIYSYKGQGIKTSENEIARIAINFLVTDYRENGKNSALHLVINALNT